MANYGKSLARDVNGNPLQEYSVPYPALASYQRETAVVSSTISLTPNTTEMEIGAVGGSGIVIRWIKLTETASVAPFASVVASGLGANFDNFIPAGTVRRFVVPRETQGQVAGGQIGSVNGLYQRVSFVNAGITGSSILAVEI